VPTFAEAGLPDVELAGWVGMAGPAGLPADIVAWWSRNIAAALAKKEIVDHFRTIGVEPDPQTGPAFNRFVAEQFEVWGRHIRGAGIEPE
jgi:tripartite-type tricarboxylate transporter receptor subunit TctC